jgi:hypothetical protein
MKLNIIKLLSFTMFLSCMLTSSQVFSQAGEMKPGSETKQMEGEKSSADIKTSGLRGEYTKEVECANLYVRKGCINYTIAGPNAGSEKESTVKVCASKKPVQICRKGGKILKVKYEKLNADALVEFKPISPEVRQ